VRVPSIVRLPGRPRLAPARLQAARILLIVTVLAAVCAGHRIFAAPTTSVDLGTYVRIGRFDLPEPTRTPAPPNSLLAQEASAVTYNWDTDTLFVVGDGGTSVVQVTKAGQLIDSMTLAPGASPQGTEFYDTEGITYVGGGKFVLLEERYRQANLFTYVGGGTLHTSDVKTVKLGTTIGNTGLEGISYDPMTGGFIVVKEKDPQSIFQTGIDFNAGTSTNGSPAATSSTDLFNPALANLSDFSDVFALSTLPFLSGQSDSSHLLVISQESGQIINVDRSGAVHSRLTIVADPGSPLSVPDMTMEGVTMDRDGLLYVVNENGGGDANHPQLWIYAHSDAQNLPPTGVTLSDAVTAIPENTSTAAPVKVASIVVSDDGLGTNNLTVSGADANFFQIVGTALLLKAGTPLSVFSKPSYSVIVDVDDSTVGSMPDASTTFTLTVTASTGGTPALIISEVAPWSSGNSLVGDDWFEVTNVGTATANITGWKMDDNSNSFGSAVALNGVSSIAPGQSVIFIETGSGHTAADNAAAFRSVWFGGNPPAGLQIGNYSGSGVGLSTGGDAVNLYNSAGVLQANVVFGVSPSGPSFPTFDNAAGRNNTTISALSAAGINGAFVAATNSHEIGSPGTIGALPTPVVTIAATDGTAAETGSSPGSFRISRTGSTVGPLTVNYTIATGAGKATAADYTPTLTGAATFAPGQSFLDIVISPVDDSLFEGPESLTLSLFDTGSYDVGEPSTATVTIADNDPPDTAIDSWPVNPSNSAAAHFTFSASQPASAITGFECSLDGAPFTACISPVSYTGLTDGSHAFQVRAVDYAANVDPTPASFTWTVDTTPPVVSCAATPNVIWPPNDKLVAVSVTVNVSDALPGPAGFTLTSITTNAPGTDDVQEFKIGAASTTGFLRASRAGSGNGHAYTLTYAGVDMAGNSASCSAKVVVPHDQGK
jgi:uncharacterized protein YjiK